MSKVADLKRENSLQSRGIKLGLERITELMHLLGDPQDKLKFIHVAGTNGKGSTCSFISAMLAANGYKVGMYTSPAVEDIREQYTITRLLHKSELPDEYAGMEQYTGLSEDDAVLISECISQDDYAQCAAEIYAAQMGRMAEQAQGEPTFRLSDIDENDIGHNDISDSEYDYKASGREYDAPTAFEIETALAFLYFYKNKCDYVVLETGMGGRDDATNVVKTTVLSVLTSISEDHVGMIGDNITEIAQTKAGIIKPGVPVVMVCNIPEVEDVIRAECNVKRSQLSIISAENNRNVKLSVSGSYQIDNAVLALKALDVLAGYDSGLNIDEDVSKQALSTVVMPCRMEKICDDPLFYLDGAHNPDAAIRLKETLEELFGTIPKFIFIIGMFRDKDYRKVIRTMIPLADVVYTVQTPDNPRALPTEELKKCIEEEWSSIRPEREDTKNEKDVYASGSIEEAVNLSLQTADKYKAAGLKPVILAFGSLSYLRYIKTFLYK